MKEEEESESPQEDHQQQYRPLTIVYDGKISVTDATEIQVCVYESSISDFENKITEISSFLFLLFIKIILYYLLILCSS